jgi:hypothetical protein
MPVRAACSDGDKDDRAERREDPAARRGTPEFQWVEIVRCRRAHKVGIGRRTEDDWLKP